MFKELQTRIGVIWCGLAHKSVMWPAHGHYTCRTCGRRYIAFAEPPAADRTGHVTWKPAASLMLALMVATYANPLRAGDVTKVHAPAEARSALDRYMAAGMAAPWAAESLEIHASIPRIEKTGSLRAIRRLDSTSDVRYEALQLAGDRTVKEQVIVRYLKADEQAAEIPPASIAITPANYKFAYKGMAAGGEHAAWIFQMTPRRKREGLISGELWLDRQSGLPVRQSGRLVKSPSVFIRRISVTREDDLRDGKVASRLTHITVDTRLVGCAQLVIRETPLQSSEAVQLASSNLAGGQ